MSVALRAAIVGFGGMGQRHYRAHAANGTEVVAICDWRPERVREVLAGFPARRVYSSVEALLDAVSDVDMLSVVSNGPTHAEIAIAAMRRGVRRIMLEKPVATSLADADAVLECARQTGARVAVNHLRRWSADYRRLKALIDGGSLGRLRHIYFSCGSTGLGNFVSHAFDLMRWMFDSDAAHLAGWIDRTGTPNPRGVEFVDPGGYAVIRFAEGQRGFVDASEDTGVQYVFNFVCEYGRVVVDELNNAWTARSRRDDTRALPFTRYPADTALVPFDPCEPYDITSLTARALAELAGDGPISCGAIEGAKALELVVAVHESDAQGHIPVAIPLIGAARQRAIAIG